jgi:hypothetical protein
MLKAIGYENVRPKTEREEKRIRSFPKSNVKISLLTIHSATEKEALEISSYPGVEHMELATLLKAYSLRNKYGDDWKCDRRDEFINELSKSELTQGSQRLFFYFMFLTTRASSSGSGGKSVYLVYYLIDEDEKKSIGMERQVDGIYSLPQTIPEESEEIYERNGFNFVFREYDEELTGLDFINVDEEKEIVNVVDFCDGGSITVGDEVVLAAHFARSSGSD